MVAKVTVDRPVGAIGDHKGAWPGGAPPGIPVRLGDDVPDGDDRPVGLDRHVVEPFPSFVYVPAFIGGPRGDPALLPEAMVEPAPRGEAGKGGPIGRPDFAVAGEDDAAASLACNRFCLQDSA